MENINPFIIPVEVIAKIGFYLLLIAYVIFTAILHYHWQNYSMNKIVITQTYIAYFTISLPLIFIMSLAILAI